MLSDITYTLDPGVVAALIGLLGAVAVFFWGKALEKRSLNSAILAEIRRLIHVIRRHHDWWSKCIADKNTNYPLIPFSHAVYTKQVKNIGGLAEHVVVRAVTFYGHLDFLNSLQASRPHYDAAGKSVEFNTQYLGVVADILEEYEHAFDHEFQTPA